MRSAPYNSLGNGSCQCWEGWPAANSKIKCNFLICTVLFDPTLYSGVVCDKWQSNEQPKMKIADLSTLSSHDTAIYNQMWIVRSNLWINVRRFLALSYSHVVDWPMLMKGLKPIKHIF